MTSQPTVILILHNLRSSFNVGAIFRTAEAIGAEKIYLTGYTPAPIDRFGRINKEVAKTALGAEHYVPWEKVKSLSSLMLKLSATSYQLVALEQAKDAIDYKKVKLRPPTAIVVGNEVRGLSRTILDKCDVIAEIPLRGKKESLNVAVVAGIALYRWLDV